MLQKLKPIFVLKKLKEKGLNIFTPLEFRRVFNVSSFAANWFIKTYVKKELFTKIRNGLYILIDSSPNYYLVANRLYEPSYISLDAALSFYNLIPETIYTISSITPKATREFTAVGILFTYQRIKREAYIGYKSIKYMGETVLMAEPEKALADYLYFIDLGKRQLSYERLDLAKIKRVKLIRYVKLFKRPRMLNLIEQIYAEFKKPKRIY